MLLVDWSCVCNSHGFSRPSPLMHEMQIITICPMCSHAPACLYLQSIFKKGVCRNLYVSLCESTLEDTDSYKNRWRFPLPWRGSPGPPSGARSVGGARNNHGARAGLGRKRQRGSSFPVAHYLEHGPKGSGTKWAAAKGGNWAKRQSCRFSHPHLWSRAKMLVSWQHYIIPSTVRVSWNKLCTHT